MFGLFRKTNIRKATDVENTKSDIKEEENCGYCSGPEPTEKDEKLEKDKVKVAASG